jgi:hypothetical protein
MIIIDWIVLGVCLFLLLGGTAFVIIAENRKKNKRRN